MYRISCALYGWTLPFLLGNCNPEKPPTTLGTSFHRQDAGPVTVQIPATWQALDYARAGLDTARKGQHYLFLNTQSKDTAQRETIILTVTQRKGKASFAHADTLLPTILEGLGLKQIRVRQFTDTLLTNPIRELAIVEFDCRLPVRQLDLLGTYAFYKRDSMLVTVTATGLRTSDISSSQKRALFQRVIQSVQWK